MPQCPGCGRKTAAALPWCPDCGAEMQEQTRKPRETARIEEPQKFSEYEKNTSGGQAISLTSASQEQWVEILACRSPIGTTVTALLEHLGIEFITRGDPDMGEAGRKLYPVVLTRRRDASRAIDALDQAGLI